LLIPVSGAIRVRLHRSDRRTLGRWCLQPNMAQSACWRGDVAARRTSIRSRWCQQVGLQVKKQISRK